MDFSSRQIRRTLYMLKRRHGKQVTLYRLLGTDTDPRTGTTTQSVETAVLKRGIVLPSKMERKVVSVNTELDGFFDIGNRVFILDRKDLPSSFELRQDDWLVFNGSKYSLEKIHEFDDKVGWLISGRRLEGEQPSEVHTLTGYDIMDLQHGVQQALE